MPELLNIAAVAGGQNTIITLSDTMDGGEKEEKKRRGGGREGGIEHAEKEGRDRAKEEGRKSWTKSQREMNGGCSRWEDKRN